MMNRRLTTPDEPRSRRAAGSKKRGSATEGHEVFLTARQLAAVIQVSESTVRRLAREGRIPSVRVTPHLLRFHLEAVLSALGHSSRVQRSSSRIEQPPEESKNRAVNRARASKLVNSIDDLRERLFVKYGEMLDSTALVREDRAR